MSGALSNLLGYVQISRQNVAGSLAFCSQVTYETWLYTGQFTGGIEPTWCIGFLCFSADNTGNVSVSVAALGAIKLTKNAISGDWGLSLDWVSSSAQAHWLPERAPI